jgi:hypothetical protein
MVRCARVQHTRVGRGGSPHHDPARSRTSRTPPAAGAAAHQRLDRLGVHADTGWQCPATPAQVVDDLAGVPQGPLTASPITAAPPPRRAFRFTSLAVAGPPAARPAPVAAGRPARARRVQAASQRRASSASAPRVLAQASTSRTAAGSWSPSWLPQRASAYCSGWSPRSSPPRSAWRWPRAAAKARSCYAWSDDFLWGLGVKVAGGCLTRRSLSFQSKGVTGVGHPPRPRSRNHQCVAASRPPALAGAAEHASELELREVRTRAGDVLAFELAP